MRAFFARRNIADNILPQPVGSDALPPPTALPPVVKQFLLPFDKEAAYKMHKLADRAGLQYQPNSISPDFLGQISQISEGFKLFQDMQKLVPLSRFTNR